MLLVLTLAACQPPSATGRGGSQLTGAATPQLAVEQFLNAARAQDLQAMSVVWGTARGPARDRMDRTELEKREVILQCYFTSDRFRVLNSIPAQDGRQAFRVELTRGGRTRTPTIYTVRGPSGRWYVENLDMAAVRDFCGGAPNTP